MWLFILNYKLDNGFDLYTIVTDRLYQSFSLFLYEVYSE